MKFIRRKGKENALSEKLEKLKKDGFLTEENYNLVKNELHEELKDEFIKYNTILDRLIKEIELKNLDINLSVQEIQMMYFNEIKIA